MYYPHTEAADMKVEFSRFIFPFEKFQGGEVEGRSWDVYIHTHIHYIHVYIHRLDYVDVWVGLGWAGLGGLVDKAGGDERGPSGNSPEEQTRRN